MSQHDPMPYTLQSIYHVTRCTRELMVTVQADDSWMVKVLSWDGHNVCAPYIIVPADDLDTVKSAMIEFGYVEAWSYENLKCFKRGGGFHPCHC